MRYIFEDELQEVEYGSDIYAYQKLLGKIEDRVATVGVVGLGYVGLPLLRAVAAAGFFAIGVDIDKWKIDQLSSGRSYIRAVTDDDLDAMRGRVELSSDIAVLTGCDVVVLCVPTPVKPDRTPDQSFVEAISAALSVVLRAEQLVIAESTNYPGSTRNLIKPILERSGLIAGVDFFLGYSPERQDPGNEDFGTESIPKLVSGLESRSLRLTYAFYSKVVREVVPVSSTETAEAAKLLENTFRAVNISLVNELKQLFDELKIDVWEVIEAARTKPFGFMPFYPGPGIGGHCIPVDPLYLVWRARSVAKELRIVGAAEDVNREIPRYVVDRALSAYRVRTDFPETRPAALVIGITYKRNVPDTRESPALRIMALLAQACSVVSFHDPFVPNMSVGDENRNSVALNAETFAKHDLIVICVDHDQIDFSKLEETDALIVDTINAMGRRRLTCKHLVKA